MVAIENAHNKTVLRFERLCIILGCNCLSSWFMLHYNPNAFNGTHSLIIGPVQFVW